MKRKGAECPLSATMRDDAAQGRCSCQKAAWRDPGRAALQKARPSVGRGEGVPARLLRRSSPCAEPPGSRVARAMAREVRNGARPQSRLSGFFGLRCPAGHDSTSGSADFLRRYAHPVRRRERIDILRARTLPNWDADPAAVRAGPLAQKATLRHPIPPGGEFSTDL